MEEIESSGSAEKPQPKGAIAITLWRLLAALAKRMEARAANASESASADARASPFVPEELFSFAASPVRSIRTASMAVGQWVHNSLKQAEYRRRSGLALVPFMICLQIFFHISEYFLRQFLKLRIVFEPDRARKGVALSCFFAYSLLVPS